jgi:hypothetical protein
MERLGMSMLVFLLFIMLSVAHILKTQIKKHTSFELGSTPYPEAYSHFILITITHEVHVCTEQRKCSGQNSQYSDQATAWMIWGSVPDRGYKILL